MRTTLDVRLLGRFEVSYGNKTVRLSSRPAQSLFAFLILHSGTAFRREKLAGQLWPDSPEASARDYLRHALWRIRKALQEAAATKYLQADDLTIALVESSDFFLDVAALRAAEEAGPADQLAEALDCYEGELLPGFYEEWVLLEREELQAAFERKIASLLELLQQGSRWTDVLVWGEKWIGLGQKPESAYRYLMYAHAAQGDLVKTAATYERCAKALAEFGMEPSEQTRKLLDDLRSGKVKSAAVARRAEVGQLQAPASNIPVPLTSFVGREAEVTQVVRLLGEKRLVKLTGSGGVGKTRLAIEVARKLEKRFRDGTYWVGLVGLSDPDLIPQEIAQAIQVREVPSEPLLETVKSRLRSKDILLVLDNCEHLIRACAECTEQLLSGCPRLKVLTTSIEALGLFNETTWQVPSLALPEARRATTLTELESYASIQLFLERAANAKLGFALNEHNAASVAKICQRLDGIPLAIELAAARIKVLTIHEIVARLDDRFSRLTSGSRTAIPRHQTLRATIDWSHELLSEPERILFRRLAVFSSGCSLEGAEKVCSTGDLKSSDILDTLARLVDRSLVAAESEADLGETRYRLLETIRQYALEKLVSAGEAHSLRQRHAEYFLQFAEEVGPQVYGINTPRWVRQLDRELENIRAAIEWFTLNGKAELALQILGDLVYYWFAHGLVGSEWFDQLHDALSRPEGRERTLARAKALNGIGFMYWADIYPAAQRSELEEALSIAEELGDPWNSAAALRSLGLFEHINGHYDAARAYLEQSIELFRKLGTRGRMEMANSLIFLGDLALNQDGRMEARSLYEEAATVLRGAGDMNFLAYTVRRLGHLDWLDRNFQQAKSRCVESLDLNLYVGDPRGVIGAMAGFAAIAVAQCEYERAATLMAAVQTQLEAMKISLLYIDRMEFERNLKVLQREMSERSFQKRWSKGRALSFESAKALALEVT